MRVDALQRARSVADTNLMPRSSAAALLSVFALVLSGGLASASAGAAPVAPAELLVRFEPGAAQAKAIASVGGTVVGRLPARDLVLVRLARGASPTAADAILEQRADVSYSRPNRTYELFVEPNDAMFSELWGIAKIEAPLAWDEQTGSDAVTVAVVDSGIDYTHPDLTDNIWRNAAELGGVGGVDDDGNGFVDDITGWDFFAPGGDNAPLDESSASHGTHVAGTIGARGNNLQGVTGVNWNVRLMPLRTGNLGLSEWAIINAFRYACANGAEIVNGSFGGDYSQDIQNEIASTACANTLFVFAAGNGGSDQVGDDNDAVPQFPCVNTAPNVVCVAATSPADTRASFSNFGLTTVDLAAPGTSIKSTTRSNTYGFLSGTSMATPHVAGAAALVWAERPALTVAEVRNALLLSVDPVPGLQVATGGRLNVGRALRQEVIPPTGLTASSPSHPGPWSNNQTVSLSWGGATDANGIDGYSFAFSPVPGFVPDEVKDAEETTTSLTMLLADGEHWFHVRARDGSGNWGAAVHVGPIRIDTFAPVRPVPSSPSHLVGGASADRTVDVAWSGASDSASGLDGFSFSWSQGRAVAADQTKNVEENVVRTTSPKLAVGAWWFNIRARDNAGNWSDTVSVGPFSIRGGPTACLVPRLRGLTLVGAKRLLVKRGCSLGRVTRVKSRRVARGRVVAQRPAPGLRRPRGARVAVVLSRGRR